MSSLRSIDTEVTLAGRFRIGLAHWTEKLQLPLVANLYKLLSYKHSWLYL